MPPRYRLLVADDDQALRAALERALRFEGYAVALAADGDEVISQVRAHPPDLVVLDLAMPGTGGVEACRRLRAEGNHVPVLMLTARDGVSARVAGLDAGADDYLVKPFALQELLARLRALLLELERLYNHVADIGALCNDVGFGLAQARALTLRERLLRLNAEVTGHRLLRGAIRPGGTSVRRLPDAGELAAIERQLEDVIGLATASTVVMDRFKGTAVLSGQDAAGIGTVGVVARASGLTLDARLAHPFTEPPDSLRPACQDGGDVMARFTVRTEEARTSLRLIAAYAGQVTALTAAAAPPEAPRSGSGLGIVEGWRGSTVHRVEISAAGVLTRCKIADPSFLNWPALSVALAGTIVPDFPLANKSFNLSYAGNDL